MSRCTCPMVPPHDDPYFHCDYCDQRMEEASRAHEHQERESELDYSFAQLCDVLDALTCAEETP